VVSTTADGAGDTVSKADGGDAAGDTVGGILDDTAADGDW
jgi:hypothetical protein